MIVVRRERYLSELRLEVKGMVLPECGDSVPFLALLAQELSFLEAPDGLVLPFREFRFQWDVWKEVARGPVGGAVWAAPVIALRSEWADVAGFQIVPINADLAVPAIDLGNRGNRTGVWPVAVGLAHSWVRPGGPGEGAIQSVEPNIRFGGKVVESPVDSLRLGIRVDRSEGGF